MSSIEWGKKKRRSRGSRIRAYRRRGWKGVAGFRRGGGGPPWWPARSSTAATFRRSAGDGERRGRYDPPSWSLRRRRRAPTAPSSGGTAQRSLAPKVAAALCGGRRGTQVRNVAGGFYGRGAQETKPCPARTPRGGTSGMLPVSGESGSSTRRRQRQMGLRGLGAGAGWTGRNRS
jgi:hypothetical protein